MKAIVTFIFIIFISTSAMTQGVQNEVKVETFSAGVELNIKVGQEKVQNTKVARLYKFKNSRVKKALSFRTKRNKPKMA